jgi:predicted flap endonuclease-1-like 5' DNA nuclease
MAYKIDEIEGIGPANAEKLAAAKIATTDDLLKLCCAAKGRKEIAASTGVGEGTLLKWANMADLMRISGIAGEYAELLKASGVDTIKELRTRNAENLAEKAKQVNEEKSLTRAVPSASVIADWIEKAKQMDPMITH